TLAEVFREAGYATLSVSSVPFSGQMTNLHQGFEQLHERSSISEGGSKTAREYVDRLLPWLATHREVPFFVFLHVFDPHDPFEPRKPFNTLWASAERGEEHKKQMEDLKKFIKRPFMKRRALPNDEELKKSGLDREAFLSQLHDWYDGSIRGMGAEIERILGQLRTLDLDDKTLIVFTSDHGEEFLEHGKMFHGQSVYGELSNIPLIMHGAGMVPAGVQVDETVQSIDIMPTILELSGLPVPEGIQGRSLVPFFKGSPPARTASLALWQQGGEDSPPAQVGVAQSKVKWDRPAMSEKAVIPEGAGPGNESVESIAFLKDGWKLIRNRKEGKGEPTYELFDHRNDPLDAKDLADEKPDLVTQLAADLEAFQQKAWDAKLPPDSAGQKAMSKEELERLRSLGYIQ
ncbi:MAG: sulfatase-like hydrolase/transferase, partial [Acidobacteria bacterium]|nr:sulfatase-like hydrolase/transferase [Acidobacteriota bacterium]